MCWAPNAAHDGGVMRGQEEANRHAIDYHTLLMTERLTRRAAQRAGHFRRK